MVSGCFYIIFYCWFLFYYSPSHFSIWHAFVAYESQWCLLPGYFPKFRFNNSFRRYRILFAAQHHLHPSPSPLSGILPILQSLWFNQACMMWCAEKINFSNTHKKTKKNFKKIPTLVQMHLGIFPNYCIFETGIVVRNTLVTYDRGNDKVGFWKTNCSELWRRLQLPSVPAPPPSISSSNDSSIGMPPRLAPDGLPLNVLPGRITLQNVVGLFGSP